MSVKLGKATCVDPLLAHDECLRLKHPIGKWHGQANHFKCPLGHLPGTGLVLMRKGDLDAIGIDETHDLVFEDSGERVTLKGIVIVDAKAINPGARDDPNAIYQVSLADDRIALAEQYLGRRYNMVADDGGSYQDITQTNDPTSDSDSEEVGYRAYTWQEMLDSIWGLAGLGSTTPTLDPVPHGTPENFDFDTDHAMFALGVVLDRLGLALRWTPWTGVYDIVTLGEELSDEDDLNISRKPRRFDQMPAWADSVRIPGSVRVVFAVCPPSCGYGPTCSVVVSRPNPPQDEVRNESAVKVIFDDMIGRYSTDGTSDSDSDSDSDADCSASGCTGLSNSAQIARRACERATDFYRMLVDGCEPFLQVIDGAVQITPNGRYKVVAWEDRGNGVATTVYGGKDVLPPLELWHQWHRNMAERNLCGCDDYIEEDYITGFCLIPGEPETSSDSESAA